MISSVFVLASITARAQTLAAARILSSEGPVEIERHAQGQAALLKVAYRINDELLAGDVIRTLKGGRLVLGLADGSQAIVGEKTTLEILDLSLSPRTIFNVLRGKTRVRIEKVGGRPNPYRVNTPTTVIAVRGTLFDVFVTEQETRVFVHEGEVAVSNIAQPNLSVILSPGLRTSVSPRQPPDAPTRFQPGRNDETFRPHPSERGPGDGPPGERGAGEQGRRAGGVDRKPPPDPSPRDAGRPAQGPPGDGGRGAGPSGGPGGPTDGGRMPHEQFSPDDN